jgi:hypothetical protein
MTCIVAAFHVTAFVLSAHCLTERQGLASDSGQCAAACCFILCTLQDRWLENRVCAYAQGSTGELPEGERRNKRFLPFSDGIKNCLGQVRGSCGHWLLLEGNLRNG